MDQDAGTSSLYQKTGKAMTTAWPEFIASVVLPTMPPDLPFATQGWAGMAFDRTAYEDLAPSVVWECWLATHNETVGYPSGLGAIGYRNISAFLTAAQLKPDMDSIRAYWNENDSFLRDHYVFSLGREWIVRLDQDTTLFLGTLDFMRSVVDRLGGVADVKKMMNDDLIGDVDDVVGLGGYLDGLLAPLS
ncbi:hypothetical protein [Stenotrophomonas sp. PD6]|uniref:hypothetical protein n=1 Tax=Stenotrophomonas sp. PD6 TaxID=3368612 RepID=UPI003B9DEE08